MLLVFIDLVFTAVCFVDLIGASVLVCLWVCGVVGLLGLFVC